MDNRPYFFLGDIFSNVVTGIAAGWLSWLLIGTAWNMWLAMVAAMVVGMVVAGILFIPLSVFFGAMEVMVPTMLSGMLSGMVVGMWCAMVPVEAIDVVLAGGASGLAGFGIVWLFNLVLRGSVPLGGRGK